MSRENGKQMETDSACVHVCLFACATVRQQLPVADARASAVSVMCVAVDEHGDMKNDAIAQAGVALEQFTQEKEIAKHIKMWMEEKYGPTWHCIVSSEYKTAFTYESKNFVRFNVGKKCIMLFRHP